MAETVEQIPERVLVVAAHPDDAEFGCGGTVAKWVRQGATAYYLICTNGDKGSDDFGVDPVELAALREREQRAAAEVIGVSTVVFLPRRDGELIQRRFCARHFRYCGTATTRNSALPTISAMPDGKMKKQADTISTMRCTGLRCPKK